MSSSLTYTLAENNPLAVLQVGVPVESVDEAERQREHHAGYPEKLCVSAETQLVLSMLA